MFVLSKDIPTFHGIARKWSSVEVISRYNDASGVSLLNIKADGKEIYGVAETSVVEKKMKDPF